MSSSPLPVLGLILAAGAGKRMKSTTPKTLLPLGGLPLVAHVQAALQAAGIQKGFVISHPSFTAMEKAVYPWVCLPQTERLGTAHALLTARKSLEACAPEAILLVALGDAPLVSEDLFRRAAGRLLKNPDEDLTVVGFEASNPAGYGRIVEAKKGFLRAIVEEKDLKAPQKGLSLCNSGLMAMRLPHIWPILESIDNRNEQREFYLTQAVEKVWALGKKVSHILAEEREVQGINDPRQLAEASRLWQEGRRHFFLSQGVLMEDPAHVYFSWDTQLDSGVYLEPYVYFGPGVHLKAGTRVRAFSHLEGVRSGLENIIGPYARLRGATSLEDGVRIGNFVEIKNASLGAGVKVGHLSYIGDATVGAQTNIGAGTITCNYDGYRKHSTIIGHHVFVGSQTTFLAPVKIGDGTFIGADSVVDEDLPQDSLAISRPKLVIREHGAARYRQKRKKAPPEEKKP